MSPAHKTRRFVVIKGQNPNPIMKMETNFTPDGLELNFFVSRTTLKVSLGIVGIAALLFLAYLAGGRNPMIRQSSHTTAPSLNSVSDPYTHVEVPLHLPDGKQYYPQKPSFPSYPQQKKRYPAAKKNQRITSQRGRLQPKKRRFSGEWPFPIEEFGLALFEQALQDGNFDGYGQQTVPQIPYELPPQAFQYDLRAEEYPNVDDIAFWLSSFPAKNQFSGENFQ